MIDEARVESAVNYLSESAEPLAQARADRIALEEGRKRLKAVIMSEHVKLPIAAQEREAYRDDRYGTHLDGLREAVYREQKLLALRDAAVSLIDAWRSMSANQRGRI